ncbi:MAG: DUF5686 and carboxypeptidase regulatory-like domain-containing protein [Bacteroidales bacterium]|nr:DUF5686 and carboxypeptidase regulatory-like domain-containing protein [Bacteroidales bacterium]MCF8458250.1 DUF5686 and carboxypeptidase regulatory-like domain-containing protein [Bacteroidales bacterium]
MAFRFYLSAFITAAFTLICISQFAQTPNENEPKNTYYSDGILKGLVADKANGHPLPYTNIYEATKRIGVISNEKGMFSIDVSTLKKEDTLYFQYLGYKTGKMTVGELISRPVVYLEEEIINLSEILVFGNDPDPEEIVKQVLLNKAVNYRSNRIYYKKQAFIRERDITDITDIKLDYKKSSIEGLDKEMIAMMEQNIPKQTTSFTDFLGTIYVSKDIKDSIRFKMEPTKAVSLKEKDIVEMDRMNAVFTDISNNTKEGEYWKIKSGVFSFKMDMDEEGEVSGEVEDSLVTIRDSLPKKNQRLKYYSQRMKLKFRFSQLINKQDWEFLYETGRYKYTLDGGTRVNGEDVYIIDFAPKRRGEYTGRMYITTNTYALIRADFEYAPERIGTDIHLLGIGYTENAFKASIYFEKKEDYYALKYFSKKKGYLFHVDRPLSIVKKRKRRLLDKKVNEVKVGLEIAAQSEQSIEVLILDETELTHEQFTSIIQKDDMEVIYVDQFDDELWKGFSIIEPTKQMKEYKKQRIQ